MSAVDQMIAWIPGAISRVAEYVWRPNPERTPEQQQQDRERFEALRANTVSDLQALYTAAAAGDLSLETARRLANRTNDYFWSAKVRMAYAEHWRQERARFAARGVDPAELVKHLSDEQRAALLAQLQA